MHLSPTMKRNLNKFANKEGYAKTMPKYTMRKAIGIDLGTTNSAVAIMTPTDTEITIHSDPKTKKETTPSCVWKDPKNGQVIVGSKAYSRIGSRPEPIK